MNVSISRGGGSVVPFHNGGAVLGVVEEVEAVAALGHMDNVLAVEGVVGHRAVHGFLYPQPFAVVLERCRGAALAHLLELPALFPGVAPGAVTGGIANHVAGYGVGYRRVCTYLHTVLGQLVLPVAVPIGVTDSFLDRSDSSSRIRVPLLVQNVAAQIVGVYPRGASHSAGGIILVVHTGELAQFVVGICGQLPILRHRLNVPHIIIGVGEVFSRLRNAGNQAGGGAAVVTARQIAVGSSIRSAACRDRPGSHAANSSYESRQPGLGTACSEINCFHLYKEPSETIEKVLNVKRAVLIGATLYNYLTRAQIIMR